MKFVGAYEVFCDLCDVALLICGKEFRADGRIDDIEERCCTNRVLLLDLLGQVAYQRADEGLRNGDVDGIHRHVVAIISRPSKCQFRQIAGTHHKTVGLIGNVHQNLRALSGLCVFISDIVHFCVVIYVRKMLHYGLSDIHFAHCDAKCLHQLNRIVVGASRCAESGHRYADYAATLYAEEIKCTCANQECQS